MGKRSVYNIQLTCDSNVVNQIVQEFLNEYGFHLKSDNTESYYIIDGGITAYKCFKYMINNNLLSIEAWTIGGIGEMSLEQEGFVGLNIPTNEYRNMLNSLFDKISKINTSSNNFNVPNNNTNSGIQVNNGTQGVQINQTEFAKEFQTENTKKNEKLCNIGFWLSIFGLFISIFGFFYSLLIYIMEFYFAIQGLKTRKRKKAIATIVISIISICITIAILIG